MAVGNIDFKGEMQLRREYPRKEHTIIVNAYESPPDGWRYDLVLRSPGRPEEQPPLPRGIPLPEPGTVTYKSQEEAFQAGLEFGKAVIDRL